MKKFLTSLFSLMMLICCLITITSCEETPSTNQYNIKYIIDGSEYDFESLYSKNVSTYQKGEIITFPTPSKEGYIFDGWYLSSTSKDNIIKTTEGFNQDLVLYGYFIVDEKVNEDDVSKLFKYTSFSYTLKYDYDNYLYEEDYVVNNGDFSCSSDGVRVSFVTIDSTNYCYYEDEIESFYLTEEDEEYTYFYDTYYLLDLSSIDTSKLSKVDDYYTVSSDYLNDAGLIFTGYLEEYLSVKIYTEANKLSKIILESIDSEEIKTKYELIFTSFEEIKVSYDKDAPYYGVEFDYDATKIQDVYSYSSGDTVTIEGEITGIYGNNFYISDDSSSILVYLGNNTEYNDLIELGNTLTLSGTVDIYKTIHQIKDITSIGYTSDTFDVNKQELSNINQNTLGENVGMIISTNVKVSKLPSSYDTSGKDITFEVSDGSSSVSVFMSKHLDASTKNEFFSVLKNLKVGDAITIDNAFISYYNSYQLVLVEGSNISKEASSNTESHPTIKYEPREIPLLYARDYFIYEDSGYTYTLTRGLPSVGDVEVLVIPVFFKNENIPSGYKETLDKAFFGTSADTGYESLSSYYYKSSYGALNISGIVLDGYNTGKTVGYYDNLYNQYLDDYDAYMNYESEYYPNPVEYEIIKEALEYYDATIDFSKYDSDGDGYIDSIYFVYMNEYNEDEDSLWWAYTDEYITEDVEYYDNVEVDFYMFASYYFLFDEFYGHNIKLNCETFIHETGHLLGLDDYYDYDYESGSNALLGGGDMMDNNVGDHNAFSKTLLGWINPYVVRGTDTTLTIGSLVDTGDAIFIFKDFKDSLFSEFIMIDLYTPTSLNEGAKGEFGLPSEVGVRIIHVNATLNTEEVYSIFEITKYNNSYTNIPLLSMIEMDKNNSIVKTGYSSNSDLFYEGSVLNNYKWSDGTSVNFTISVDSLHQDSATITIDYK